VKKLLAARNLVLAGLALACLGLLGGCAGLGSARRAPSALPRIGYLSGGAPPTAADSPFSDFEVELGEAGYANGERVVVEYRWADGREERLPGLAEELVRSGVAVIVTQGSPATLAARGATGSIPIVQASGGADLVREGLIASLAHPGGNVTGLTDITVELNAKRLELLKQAVPRLRRVGVLWNPASAQMAGPFQETAGAALSLGLQVQSLPLRSEEELEPLLDAAARDGVEALVLLSDPLVVVRQPDIAALAKARRWPSISDRRAYAAAGGLLSYGPDPSFMQCRAAAYVAWILSGTRPEELPVEQPTRFELVVNQRTALALRLSVPQMVLEQANEVLY
jgi:putative ABC transport system substrate-binding protein